jgi:hypothetical protein
MGTYCTTTSLAIIMIGTTFDSVTTSLATKMITHAENEVNKYISKRYDTTGWTTAASTPPLITSIAETLAEGYMSQRMSRGGKEAMARGAALIKQGIDNLVLLQDFKSDLIDSTGGVIADFSNTAYQILSNNTNYAPTFNEDSELNWRVDPDKLDDIKDSRD